MCVLNHNKQIRPLREEMNCGLEVGPDVVSVRVKTKKKIMKKLQIAICAASLAVAMSASANITYDNTIAPIVGSGNSSSGWTSANNTDLGLTLSLRAQDRYTDGLTPNNGAGTFTFPVGQQWDYWFDVNSGNLSPSTYTYALIISSSLNPGQYVTVPISSTASDNGVAGNEFQNANWLGFALGSGFVNLPTTFYFTLDATNSAGDLVDSVNMTVNSGAAPIP